MFPDHILNDIRARWRDVFTADQHGGIICPLCNSGSGEHGTGISEVPESNGLLKCFACGWSGDIFHLYAEANHLDVRADFPTVVKQLADRLGIILPDEPHVKLKPKTARVVDQADFNTVLLHAEKVANGQRDFASVLARELHDSLGIADAEPFINLLTQSSDADPLLLFRRQIAQADFLVAGEGGLFYRLTPAGELDLVEDQSARSNVAEEPPVEKKHRRRKVTVKPVVEPSDDCLEQTDYLKRRGISVDTARHFKLSFVKHYKHSPKMLPIDAIIIPLLPSDAYIARDTNPDVDPKYKSLNSKGHKQALFNANALLEHDSVFVFEGIIDALSAFEVGFKNVVSVNGVGNSNLLKRALSEDNVKTKRLIFALDNDDAGAKALPKFFKVASDLGLIALDGRSVSGDCKDANDLLRVDRDALADNCRALLERLESLPEPRDRVFARDTAAAIPGCPYDFDIPPGWFIDDDGVCDAKGNEASLTPVFPVKRIFNHFTKNTRYVLAFFDGTWRELPVDAEMIADPSKAVKLADHGIQTFAGAAKLLVSFFNYFVKLNFHRLPIVTEYSQPGWHNDFKDFVLPNYKDYYAPALETAYGTAGTLKHWRAMAKLLRHTNRRSDNYFVTNSKMIRVLIAASFAAPLMAVLKVRTFTTYVWGNSLAGKTAAAKFAVSAWGNPDKMRASFRATANGVEAVAARSNGIPMLIDERQVAEAKLDLNKLTYELSDEGGKTRMDKNGNQRPKKTWRMTVLATGEDKLVSQAAATGAHNRVLELHLDFDEQLFDATQVPANLHHFVDEHFGLAGRAFIDRLAPHAALGFKGIIDTFDRFIAHFSKFANVYSSEHLRYVALLCTADYYLSMWVVALDDNGNETYYEHQDAWDEALEMGEYIIGKLTPAADFSDSARGWQFVAELISSNLYHFAGEHIGRANEKLRDPVYGKITWNGIHIDRIFIYPSKLEGLMKKEGYPVAKCIRDFKARGWFMTDKAGKSPLTWMKEGDPRGANQPVRMRMYVIPTEVAQSIQLPFEDMGIGDDDQPADDQE